MFHNYLFILYLILFSFREGRNVRGRCDDFTDRSGAGVLFFSLFFLLEIESRKSLREAESADPREDKRRPTHPIDCLPGGGGGGPKKKI